MKSLVSPAVVLLTFVCSPNLSADIIVDFDYSTDTTNFFGAGTAARASLEAAGARFESLFNDNLSALQPGDSGFGFDNTWSASYTDPATGDIVSVDDLTIGAKTIKVFVGARDLGGSTLGEAGPGGFSASGTADWLNTVSTRGQGDVSGADAVDFGPWGGSLAIDSDSEWNFDHTVDPSGSQSDLYSVVLHELGHVFGVGTSDSWDADLDADNDEFIGEFSVAENGGVVDLESDDAHWLDGTMSEFMGNPQETLFDPSITVGTRKELTDLDVAGLRDIGWELNAVPEPTTLSVLGVLSVGAILHRRRRKHLSQ